MIRNTLLVGAFLAAIVAANWATTTLGLVPAGPGFVATAGTYLAGLTFVLRDSLQDRLGKTVVIGLIAVGALLSAVLSPQLALASGVAFLVAELADLAVYTPLRRRGYVLAAVASNVVGAFVDTVLFLAVAGFPIWSSVPGQMIIKIGVTLVAVLLVGGVRAVLRDPQRAGGS